METRTTDLHPLLVGGFALPDDEVCAVVVIPKAHERVQARSQYHYTVDRFAVTVRMYSKS